jgi:hypothetical protein
MLGTLILFCHCLSLSSHVFLFSSGFSLSDPTLIAGRPGRTTANILINSAVDEKLYTAEEKSLLDGVDRQLEKTK